MLPEPLGPGSNGAELPEFLEVPPFTSDSTLKYSKRLQQMSFF